MQVAAILNIKDEPPDLVRDAIDAAYHYLTTSIVTVINNQCKVFDKIVLPTPKLKALNSIYRNKAYGLKHLYEIYPNADWYCFFNPSCLFTSSRVLENLKLADVNNVWVLGASGHVDSLSLPLLDDLLHTSLEKSSYFLLGCCQFLHRLLVSKLYEIDFFDSFLVATNEFDYNFPGYIGNDLSEHLYPTLARYFGGNVGVFSTYNENQWHGSYQIFPIRAAPEIEDDFPEASIIHPLNDFNHPIRIRRRKDRHVGL